MLHSQAPADPVIEAARKAADAFAQSLPDYIVKRATTRYKGNPQKRNWQTRDTVSGDVAAAHGA